MKNLKIFFLFLAISSSIIAQEYCMTTPVGFARNATGGGNTSNIVLVKTVSELQTALSATPAAIIIVTEDINFNNSMISVRVNNKTLLGLPGVKLIQTGNRGILGFSSGSSNFIIRNIIFEGPSAWDMDGSDLIQNTNCTNLWVDHCEFYDGMDGNFDNTNNADNITISWCKFGYKKPYRYIGMTGDGSGDHRLTNLVGGSGTNAPADGHFSITFMWNYWSDGCTDRMPRARNAELHILNCYYNVTTYQNSETAPNNTTEKSTTAINLTGGSRGNTCYIEGVHFKKIGTMARATAESGNTASMKLVDCIPVSGRSLPANVGTTTVQPTYPYTALPASAVEAAITSSCGAGATLIVDLEGNVSSVSGGGTVDPFGTPKNIGATSTNNSATITWNPVETATGYIVNFGKPTEVPFQGGVSRLWNFEGAWTIGESDADNNLRKDGENARFNYNPSTNNQFITFANSNPIPDLADLRITQGGGTKLRLGYGTGLLYLNGADIKVAIPCTIGDSIRIKAIPANNAAVDRGFAADGGTADATKTSSDIVNGIMTTANGTGIWAYIATANIFTITVIGSGGMNIFNIEIASTAGGTQTVYNFEEQNTNNTSLTFGDLEPETEYQYQVRAFDGVRQSAFSEMQTIKTVKFAGLSQIIDKNYKIFYNSSTISIEGIDVKEIDIYDLQGRKIASANTNKININSLVNGIYVLSFKDNNNKIFFEKIRK